MKKLSLYLLMVTGLFACKSDPNSPGVEYMPDMYRSIPYDTYAASEVFKDSSTAMLPPENSVARGQIDFDYPFPNSNEGYEMAGAHLKNPIVLSDAILDEGKTLYSNYCIHCHGKEGQGNGMVPENSDYPNPPSYSGPQLVNLPEGKMYHTITYGKNLMGSHASQLTPEERWKVIHYVTLLQNPDNPKFSDEATAAESVSVKSDGNKSETEETTNQLSAQTLE